MEKEEMIELIAKKRTRTKEERAADTERARVLDPNDPQVQDEALRAIAKVNNMTEIQFHGTF